MTAPSASGTRTGFLLSTLAGHTDVVHALAFDPSGPRLVSAGNDKALRVWDLASGREATALHCPKHPMTLAFSPGGSLLAAGDEGGAVIFRDAPSWTRRASVKGSDAPVWGLAFTPDGLTLASACGDAKVRLWDPITGQVTLVLDGHARRVNAVAFSPDGRTLASAGHDGAIKLWRAGPP